MKFIIIQMEIDMKANGKMMKAMDMEFIIFLMEIEEWVIIWIVNQ